jgi:hypothetical protein
MPCSGQRWIKGVSLREAPSILVTLPRMSALNSRPLLVEPVKPGGKHLGID